MKSTFSALILCFFGGLAPMFAHAGNNLFPADCSSILTSDGRISIDSTQNIDTLKNIPRFQSAAGYPTAQFIGPALIGQTVQVEVIDGPRVFLRGTVVGSRDDWKSFDLKEQATNAFLRISADHPQLGIRRVELLDQGLPRELFADSAELEEMEARFNREARDLKLNADRVKFETKMAWYRRWNGRNMRTTMYDRQDKLARMEYLVGLNRIDETLALLRIDVDNTKIPAIAIHKAIAERAAIRNTKTSDPAEQKRLAALDAKIEIRLKEQGEILGIHYGDYRAEYEKLRQIFENKSGLHSERIRAAAAKVLENISVVNSSAALLPELMGGSKEPDLDFIKTAFFSQKYSLLKKLEKDLWAERMTFLWMIVNKVTGQELFRRNIDGIIAKLPAWARGPLNSFRKGKRDMDARRFDIPQIERLAHLDGDAAAKAEELRKVYYGDPDSRLLKTFSRMVDKEEQEFWKQLVAAAPEDFAAIMKAQADASLEWGPLSKHYHQTQMNMMAAVISGGGVGSGFLYYKFGAQDTWLWQALDFLVQLLPFTG